MKEFEITEKREPRIKHFLREDGSFIAKIYPDTVHYQDDNQYKEIDNRLQEENGLYHTTRNNYHLWFPKRVETYLFKVETRECYMEFYLENANSSTIQYYEGKSKNKSKVVYSNVLNNVDIEYKICKYLSYCDEMQKDIDDKINKKIYILDIELPNISGIQIADKIRTDDWDSIIIFVTSHPECKNDIFYARLMAYDYISKYSTYDKRLQQSIEKAAKIVGKKRVFSYKYNRTIYRLELDNILYIERINGTKKCIIYTETGHEYEISGNMQDILDKLDESFVLSHKSCIININKVKFVDYNSNTITLTNGEVIDKLSHRKRKWFEKSLLNIR